MFESKQNINNSKGGFLNKPLAANNTFFQPKLTVNQPNDVYEQEADAMADKVMRMPDAENTKQPFFKPVLTSIQRKCKNCEEEQKLQRKKEEPIQLKPVKESALQRKCTACEDEEKKVQRKDEGSDPGGMEAPTTVHNIIKSGGQPLDGGTRDFMESRFGYDFSRVQIHNDPSAHRSSEDINALAYTHGNHVVFGEGQYQPNTNTGKQLLAHELTHVVQQTQNSDSGLTRKRNKEIQRSAYWSEASPSGKQSTGKDAEKVLERELQRNDAEIQSQAPIPNADRNGNYGLALNGFADLYKGKSLKIYFGYPTIGTCSDGESLGKPLAIRSRTKAPVSDKGVRDFMNDAPDSITMGEIKPASNDLIAFGKKQLGSYEEGITFANKQFNCWAQFKGGAEKWNKPDFHRLNTDIPAEYVYHPGSPKNDLNLGVFDFIGTEKGHRATIGRTKPHSININIPGGLYFLNAKDGVYIYYYQPADLDAVIQQLGTDRRSELFRAYLLHATELQQAVINPLTAGPEEVHTKRRSQAPDKNNNTDSDNYIQRKGKKKTESKMKDTFNLDTWESSRAKYHDDFKNKDVAVRDKLEFLEDIKKADQANHAATGQATAFHDFKVDVGMHNNKPVQKEASSLFGWMDVWASNPIKLLGRLRSKFGSAFVRVSQFFSNIKSRIGQTIQGAENENAPKGISWGQLAIKAFWGALVSLGGMVLREVDHLLVSSFVSGLKLRFEQYIPTDRAQFEEMVENEFPILKEIEGAIKTLEDGFLGTIEGIVGQFSGLIATYRSIADTFQQYGQLIKWANVALQCGTPPGLGCLKLIATALAQYWIDKILNWCWTKKKFAGLVGGIGVIKSIPKKIADFVADGIEYFLPGSFLPVFDRGIFDTKVDYDTDEILCGDEITEAQVAMTELFDTLQQKLGPNYYDLITALQKYGVPPDEPRSAEEIRELTKRIPDMTITDINMYLEKAASGGYKAGGTLNVADFLINVKEANDAYLAEQGGPSGSSTTSNNTTGATGDGSGAAAGSSGGGENQGGESTIPYFESENIHGKKFTGPGKINLNYAIFGVKRGQVKGDKIKISITALFYENSKPIDISVTNIPAIVYDRQYFKDEHMKEKTNADHAKIMGVYVEILEDVFFEKDRKRYATIYPGRLHTPAMVSLGK
jgi:hypothetical protein